MSFYFPRRPVPPLWQKVALRVLLASTVITFLNTMITFIQFENVFVGVAAFAVIVGIFMHHILRNLAVGLLWLLAEFLCAIGVIIGISHWSIPDDDNLIFPTVIPWLIVCACIFTTALLSLWSTLYHKGKNLTQPFVHPMSRERWQIVLGNFVTKRRFSSDTIATRFLRGALAFIFLSLISYLAFSSLLGKPLQGKGQVAVKALKAFRPEFPDYVHFPDWRDWLRLDNPWFLWVDTELDLPLAEGRIGYSALNISGIFSVYNSSNKIPQFRAYDCSQEPDSTLYQLPPEDHVVICSPNSSDLPSLITGHDLEVLFTIDFSMIPNTFQRPFEVGVYPSVTNLISDNRKPIYLGPGSHLVGYFSFSAKDQISKTIAAALGLRQSKQVAVSHVDSLSPDWSVPQDNNTATLRLRRRLQDDVLIEREYYENSVLSGFALLGGAWTAFNGIFAAIFGSTLLLVIFGIKPLSVYGLVHCCCSGRRSLVGRDRSLLPEERDRVIAIIREHLLDVDENEERGTHLETNIPHGHEDHSGAQELLREGRGDDQV